MTLFSNNCPQCKILESLLKSKNMNYIKSSHFDEIIRMEIKSVPVLKTNDNKYLMFNKAIEYINNK